VPTCLFVVLQNMVGFGLLSDACCLDLLHALDVFAKIAKKCSVQRSIIDGYYVCYYLRVLEGQGHGSFRPPVHELIWVFILVAVVLTLNAQSMSCP
jgi:hypothetical protein